MTVFLAFTEEGCGCNSDAEEGSMVSFRSLRLFGFIQGFTVGARANSCINI